MKARGEDARCARISDLKSQISDSCAVRTTYGVRISRPGILTRWSLTFAGDHARNLHRKMKREGRLRTLFFNGFVCSHCDQTDSL